MFPCQVCQKETLDSCSNCKGVYYCSKEHQTQHWKDHKINCHPFKIARNEQLGRHLIATRKIKQFEIVLKEAPLFRGPSQITAPVCLGCLNGIDPMDYINCEKCGWPLCGKECGQIAEHSYECELTVKRGRKANINEFIYPHPLYQCLSTARCLMLRDKDAQKWAQLNNLEALEDLRRGSMQWKLDYATVCQVFLRYFKTKLFTEAEIMRTIGILQINGHEVPSTDPPHTAIYQYASFLEHSCTPNLAKSFNKNGHLTLWAPKTIKKGEHLSICYSDAAWGTADRQRHLMQTKIFKCQCHRCIDVTEFGTNFSAIKCKKPECSGLMLPASSNDWDKDWTCRMCGNKVDIEYVNDLLDRARNDANNMLRTNENCKNYLNNYAKWLPDHHFCMSGIKLCLAQNLGKESADALLHLDDKDLEKKMQYTQELIELYETLAPCEVRMLGNLCFDLHSALSEYARRITLKTKSTNTELLKESIKFVEKAIDYLQYESNIFFEGHLLKQAKINRQALRIVVDM